LTIKIIDFFKDKKEFIYDTSSMEEAVKISKSFAKKEIRFYFLHVVQVLIYSKAMKTEDVSLKKQVKSQWQLAKSQQHNK
jgi:hypothetical protein